MLSRIWQRLFPPPVFVPPVDGIESLSAAAALRRCMDFAYRACPSPQGGPRATQLRLFANGLACVTAGAKDRAWPNAIGYTRIPPHGCEATICVLGGREEALREALQDEAAPEQLARRLMAVAEPVDVPIIRAEHAIPFAWNCQVALTLMAKLATRGDGMLRFAVEGTALRVECAGRRVGVCAGVVAETPGEAPEAHAVTVRQADVAAFHAALSGTGLARPGGTVHVGGRREALVLVCAPLGSSYPAFYSYLPAIEADQYVGRYFVAGTVQTRLGPKTPA